MSNKVSIKDIKAAVKANKQDTIKFIFGSVPNTIDVEFKPCLDLVQEATFVQRVVNGVFIGNEYHNEYKDIVFTNVLLDMLSNLSLPYVEQSDGKVTNLSILKDWDNVFHFKNTILNAGVPSNNQPKNVNDFSDYVVYLEDMVNDKIKYIKEQNMNKSKLDELFTALTDAVNKQSSSLDGVDMKAVLNNIATMKLDDKTIIDEILKQSKKDNKDKVVDIKSANK